MSDGSGLRVQPADLIGVTAEISGEHRELCRSLRDFLAEHSGEAVVRQLMESADGADPSLAAGLARLGVHGLGFRDTLGGAGYGWMEQCLVFMELGWANFCGPYLAPVALYANIMEAVGAPASMIGPALAGQVIATASFPVYDEWTGLPQLGAADRLTGVLHDVVDGASASRIAVVALDRSEPVLCVVESADAGVSPARLQSVDLTRRLAEVTLDAAHCRVVARGTAVNDAVGRAADRLVIAVAAEQVGGADRMLAMAVDYAKSRAQFGRPIGSFQAIKHRCADMMVDVESARAITLQAAALLDQGSAAGPAAASGARVLASEVFCDVAEAGLHIHGGLGFTWEHAAHLFYRRAHASRLLFGTPRRHRDLLATRLGLDPPPATG
jgi:alkylation response protein AidB-like acyl-CoA dehydrogenase